MSRRNKIIIGLAVLVLILLLLVLVWWLWRAEPVITVPTDTIEVREGIQVPANLPTASLPIGDEADRNIDPTDQAAVMKAVAMTFAERFGSYSNETDFLNFDDLRDIMTVRMRAWVENYKAQNPLDKGDNYFGINTKALSIEVVEYDVQTGQAEVTVGTQRMEAKSSTVNPRVYYQNIRVNLVNSESGWKVDAAEWL
ncbi:MAG: hypothetical protein RB292_00040 [Patescibacteria group bacterium]|jgi:hypothetical protein|nr:hypothetical protein [Patescibacteria group bacterium]